MAWQPKLNKLEKFLSLWRFRSLYLLGKSLIINVLGFSKFTYLARVLPMPSWLLTNINALVWPFLWGSRIETVARNTFFLKPCQGGLGIVNLKVKACALRSVGLLSALANPADSCFFLCADISLPLAFLLCALSGGIYAAIHCLMLPLPQFFIVSVLTLLPK